VVVDARGLELTDRRGGRLVAEDVHDLVVLLRRDLGVLGELRGVDVAAGLELVRDPFLAVDRVVSASLAVLGDVTLADPVVAAEAYLLDQDLLVLLAARVVALVRDVPAQPLVPRQCGARLLADRVLLPLLELGRLVADVAVPRGVHMRDGAGRLTVGAGAIPGELSGRRRP
jgi:hypothetical protein